MNRSDDRNASRDPRKGIAPPVRRPKGLVSRLLLIVAVVGVAGFAVSRFAARPDAHPLPAKKPLASLKPKDLQQQATEYGIAEGAKAGVSGVSNLKRINATALAPAEPEVTVTDREIVIRGVRSANPHVLPKDRGQAEQEALSEARRILIEKGYMPAKAGPTEWPLEVADSKDVAAQEETKKAWAKEGLDDGRGWVEIDAKVSHDTLRKERAKGRTAEVGFWFGTAFLVLLGGYGFLRLDMWTKGYLTLVLGLVVGAAAIGGVVALGLLVF